MDTLLDDNRDFIDPSSVSFWPVAIRWGLISALISVIFTLISNMTGLSNPSGGFMGMGLMMLIGISITVGIIVMAVRQHRDKELGGYISIGRIIAMGMVITLISAVISTFFNYIYMNFIDPNYVEDMMVGMEEMFANLGLPEEAMEEALANTRDGFAPVKMFTNGLLYAGIGGLIISLIVGAIMKKNPPTVT